MNQTMEINGLYAGFNMPVALKEAEHAQGLPPYALQQTYKVAEYENVPSNWMHGSSKASSYFVGVRPGHGMWLDFTRNEHHSHHVAVLASIQGVNPINGQKQMGFKLEQYRDRCPVHGCEFGQDRFCPQCNYKWPPQNYLATTGGGRLWIDGFMNAEGQVRQYVFTEDTAKGVAAQLIGNERVFAIGIAFYLSKEPKPVNTYRSRGGFEACGGPVAYGGPASYAPEAYFDTKGVRTRSLSRAGGQSAMPVKQIEIGAGAKINQRIEMDPENVETFWCEEPAGFLYINYTDIETLQAILSGGKRDLTAGGEGFLNRVQKVNS